MQKGRKERDLGTVLLAGLVGGRERVDALNFATERGGERGCGALAVDATLVGVAAERVGASVKQGRHGWAGDGFQGKRPHPPRHWPRRWCAVILPTPTRTPAQPPHHARCSQHTISHVPAGREWRTARDRLHALLGGCELKRGRGGVDGSVVAHMRHAAPITLAPCPHTHPRPRRWRPGTAGTRRPGRSCWTRPR